MANYKLCNTAKEDLIRIHHYGVDSFGVRQADKYFDELFKYFEKITANPFSVESVDHIRNGYIRCPCVSDTIYYRIINDEIEIMSIIGRHDFNDRL